MATETAALSRPIGRGATRPILRRASISEMVVPYGDVDPMHNWKNAFDAGEWGLGRMTTSLKLGCDCLGEIHYFDVVNVFDGGPKTRVTCEIEGRSAARIVMQRTAAADQAM